MLYEFAVEPGAIAADWQTCRYLSEKFGFDRGRLLALYPRAWLSHAIEATRHLPDVQKKAVVEKLRLLKRDCSIRTGRSYDSEVPDWLANAIEQQAVDPFRAIVATENPEGHDFVLHADTLEETQSLFYVAHDCQVPRDSASIANAISLLLKTARSVVFVYAYYDPFNPKYQRTLRACLRLVRPKNGVTACEVHHMDHRRCPSVEAIEREARTIFRDVIPADMALLIYRWREKSGGEDFHARYLLTDRGGIRVDAGFSDEGKEQTTDMALMAFELWQSRAKALKVDADVYQLIEPVLHISANGSTKRVQSSSR